MSNLAIILICTGRYNELFPAFWESLNKHLKNSHTIYVLTDQCELYGQYDNVVPLYVRHKQWPWVVLNKFNSILKYWDYFVSYDYIICMQVNMRLLLDTQIDSEGYDLMLSMHPMQNDYIQGAYLGGKPDAFKQLCIWCKTWLDKQLEEGNMPQWHDETALNEYFKQYTGQFKLNPSYIFKIEEYVSTHNSYNIFEFIHKNKFFGCDKNEYASGPENKKQISVEINLNPNQAGICIYQSDAVLSLKDVREINKVYPNKLCDYPFLERCNNLYKAICKSIEICNNCILILKFNTLVDIISEQELQALQKEEFSLDRIAKRFKLFFNQLK